MSLAEIVLKGGRRAVVDEADAPMLMQYKWFFHPFGYAHATVEGKMTTMHSLLCVAKPPLEVDHIDGDKLNNRRCNLRAVTRSVNQQAKRFSKRVGYRGVYMSPYGRFQAQITKDRKRICIGSYATAIEAAAAYDAAALRLFGPHAFQNLKGV